MGSLMRMLTVLVATASVWLGAAPSAAQGTPEIGTLKAVADALYV